MMTMTRIAALFALATLGACSTLPAGRDFNTLTLGEQVDYTSCVFEHVGSRIAPQGNTAGSVLDSILSTPGKMQETTRNAANLCAVKMWINPGTVPGLK